MSDFDRYGGTDDQQRQRRWRDEDRRRSGFFSSDRDDRHSGDRGHGRGFFSSSPDDRFSGSSDGRFGGPDREREKLPRDNQPGLMSERQSARVSEKGGFGRDREDRNAHRGNRERERSQYSDDDEKRSLPIEETEQLIASNKVEGTVVYGREGERLGTIYNFMVDKYSGRVTYAVMSYGGFLGVGQRYYPLPWRILNYDTRDGGYRVDMDYRDMERAPSFGRNDEPRFNRDYDRRVHSWYGLDY